MYSDPVLDAVALRVMAFAHPDGINIMLVALHAGSATCPHDVYALDEAALPLDQHDGAISELGRGLRYAQRQVAHLPHTDAMRYMTWLQNAEQLRIAVRSGKLRIRSLSIDQTLLRDRLMATHGIGRGEAACLAYMIDSQATGVFVSSDQLACRVAAHLGLKFKTLEDVLARWIEQAGPSPAEFDALLAGMESARYSVRQATRDQLRQAVLDRHCSS